MLNDKQKAIALEAIKDYCNGDYMDDYSGRGMYGDTCPSLVYGSQKEAINDMLNLLMLDDPGDENYEERQAIYEVLTRHEMDSMGRGVVLYFPALKVKKEESNVDS